MKIPKNPGNNFLKIGTSGTYKRMFLVDLKYCEAQSQNPKSPELKFKDLYLDLGCQWNHLGHHQPITVTS